MSHPLGYHVNFGLADRRVIARSVGERRILAGCLLEAGRLADLLCCCAADTHVHFCVRCDRARAGEMTRRVKIALQKALPLGVPFAAAHYEPIVTQSHSYRSFWYDLRQEQHHGTCQDPAFEASNLPDLLGMRVVGAYTRDNVRRELPRVRDEELWGCFGPLPEAPLRWELLGDAAAAAIGVPTLACRSPLSVAARTAAVAVASPTLGCDELAARLGCSRRGIYNLRSRRPERALVTAVERQIELRSRLAARTDAAETGARFAVHRDVRAEQIATARPGPGKSATPLHGVAGVSDRFDGR